MQRVRRDSLRWLGRQGGSLKTQVFRGGVWLFIGHGVARGAGFIKLAVLARLLTPTDFGLIGLAMLLVRWVEQFSQTGFRQALVRTPGDIEPYLDTLWTVQVIRGFALATILYLTAPLAAWFFNQPEAQPIIRALAPLITLRSLVNPATVYLTRELNFQRIAVWQSSQVVAGLMAAIPLAFFYRNVWALIWPLLVGQLVHTLASYLMHPYRPRFAFHRGQIREMASFGKWIFWKNVLNALIRSVDGIAIGKLIGTAALGLYQVAMQVATLPSQLLIHVLPQVTFPAFAKLEQPAQFRRVYLQILSFTVLPALPAAAAICVFAHVMVPLFLGHQWLTIVPLVQLLAVCGSMQTVLDVARPMLEAVGRPELQVKLQGAEAILSLILISTLTFWLGLYGAALAVLVVHALLLALQFIMLREVIGLHLREGLGALRQGATVAFPLLGFGLINAFVPLQNALSIGLGSLAAGSCAVLLWFFSQRYLPQLQNPLDTRG